MIRLLVAAAGAAASLAHAAAPQVVNPSFEAGRYTTWPGYARGSGGDIACWAFQGSAGINPVWREGQRPGHAFSDNGRVPHGRQVAFVQNVGLLSQTLRGFVKGRRYRVTYWENGRHNNAPQRNPRLKVTLGGEVMVSEHAVKPVEPIGKHAMPYAYVESAVFTAPRDGAFDLVFTTTFGDRVAVLLDDVCIVEVK